MIGPVGPLDRAKIRRAREERKAREISHGTSFHLLFTHCVFASNFWTLAKDYQSVPIRSSFDKEQARRGFGGLAFKLALKYISSNIQRKSKLPEGYRTSDS